MVNVYVSAEIAAVPLSAPSVTSRWSRPDNDSADWREGVIVLTERRN